VPVAHPMLPRRIGCAQRIPIATWHATLGTWQIINGTRGPVRVGSPCCRGDGAAGRGLGWCRRKDRIPTRAGQRVSAHRDRQVTGSQPVEQPGVGHSQGLAVRRNARKVARLIGIGRELVKLIVVSAVENGPRILHVAPAVETNELAPGVLRDRRLLHRAGATTQERREICAIGCLHRTRPA